MDRKTATAYGLLIAITTVAASIAVVWFGPTSRLVNAIVGRSDSVWTLFVIPVFLAVIGLTGALGLKSTWVYARPDELSPDAQRGLEKHRDAERRLLIGVGILVALVQLLVILGTAGVAVPFDLGVRAFFFVFGALFASAGNMIPKIPFMSRWWQLEREIYTKVSQFGGWAFVIAGISICLVALVVPMEQTRISVSLVLGLALGLVVVNALLQTILVTRKRA